MENRSGRGLKSNTGRIVMGVPVENFTSHHGCCWCGPCNDYDVQWGASPRDAICWTKVVLRNPVNNCMACLFYEMEKLLRNNKM